MQRQFNRLSTMTEQLIRITAIKHKLKINPSDPLRDLRALRGTVNDDFCRSTLVQGSDIPIDDKATRRLNGANWPIQ